MTEPTPEAHAFSADPADPAVCSVCGVAEADHPVPEEPEPPACPYPGELIYTTERRAQMVVGSSRSRTVVACPAGHWHVMPKRSSGDGVPNPDHPGAAEAASDNTEER